MQEPVHGGLAAAPRQSASRLARDLTSLLGDGLAAAYLHGSAALGGWLAERSDVDILVITAGELSGSALAGVSDVLVRAAAGSPARGLECSVVTAAQAAQPAPPWPFLLHGTRRDGHDIVVRGDEVSGDADLLMHYAVCRAAGVTLAGPPPDAVIGTVDRHLILGYLAGELDWGLANGAENYAVLNACRALVYLNDARIVSKVSGGLTAMRGGMAPPRLVRQALDQQQARAPERPPGREAAWFVQRTAAALRAAAQAATPSPPA